MQLNQIITLASAKVRLPLLAMVRSLRSVGCDLPVKVIPYGQPDFELPEGVEWWQNETVVNWLAGHRAHPMMRKYQCLMTDHYQFVDTDVIFLLDPSNILAQHTGFVASCGHWHNPAQTVTEQTRALLHGQSTTWQKSVFNAGQFACDRALFDFQTLREKAESAEFIEASLRWPYHDQPGLNLLVRSSGVPISNLTLPPFCMESTWAGDYPGDPTPFWRDSDRKPYLLHWAGTKPDDSRLVDRLFFEHLSDQERKDWLTQVRFNSVGQVSLQSRIRNRARKVWRAVTDHT